MLWCLKYDTKNDTCTEIFIKIFFWRILSLFVNFQGNWLSYKKVRRALASLVEIDIFKILKNNYRISPLGVIDREKNFPAKIRSVSTKVLVKCPILTILPVFSKLPVIAVFDVTFYYSVVVEETKLPQETSKFIS